MSGWSKYIISGEIASNITDSKCIATLDPKTGNVFLLIPGVGVQRRDAFIRVQKFP